MSNKKKKVFWLVLAFLLLIVFILLGVQLFLHIFSQNPKIDPAQFKVSAEPDAPDRVEQGDKEHTQTTVSGGETEQTDADDPPPLLANGQSEAELKEEHSYDFDKLHSELSDDVVAWIYIPGTEVNHPVLYHETEPLYYERRNAQGNYDVYGCIFAQCYNDDDFRDPNTILYGHYVTEGGADDTFFGTLHRYKNPEFFEKYRYIYVTTEKHILVYDIFAAYEYDNRHILATYDFSNDEVYEQYLQNCLNPASMQRNVRQGAELSAEDRIITLSTCTSYTDTSRRYLVQGVLVADVRR